MRLYVPSLACIGLLIVVYVETSFAQEPVTLEFESESGLQISAPSGYALASYSFGTIPQPSSNGMGIKVGLQNNTGLTLYCPTIATGPGDVLIKCRVWCQSDEVALALAGLNSPIDGSLVANIPADGKRYKNGWHTLKVICDPDDDAVVPVFQVMATGKLTTTVFIDRITIQPIRNLSLDELAELFGVSTGEPLETITISLPDLPADALPLEMVRIPSGTFLMGSPETEYGRDRIEGPQHQVTFNQPFYMGKYEVTQAQWEAVMGNHPASLYGVGQDFPVYSVSWDTCQAFITQLNKLGLGTFRLPTEAEWEYACRAGTTTRFSFGDALECEDTGKYYCNLMDQYMWWTGNNTFNGNMNGPKEAGLKSPNPWGLFDMHGNVWEWCLDWSSHYSDIPQEDPTGSSTGTTKVFRGGSWGLNAESCRSASKGGNLPNLIIDTAGLRLVREYP